MKRHRYQSVVRVLALFSTGCETIRNGAPEFSSTEEPHALLREGTTCSIPGEITTPRQGRRTVGGNDCVCAVSRTDYQLQWKCFPHRFPPEGPLPPPELPT